MTTKKPHKTRNYFARDFDKTKFIAICKRCNQPVEYGKPWKLESINNHTVCVHYACPKKESQ
jgi:ribosome biogenesis protein Tsr3